MLSHRASYWVESLIRGRVFGDSRKIKVQCSNEIVYRINQSLVLCSWSQLEAFVKVIVHEFTKIILKKFLFTEKCSMKSQWGLPELSKFKTCLLFILWPSENIASKSICPETTLNICCSTNHWTLKGYSSYPRSTPFTQRHLTTKTDYNIPL